MDGSSASNVRSATWPGSPTRARTTPATSSGWRTPAATSSGSTPTALASSPRRVTPLATPAASRAGQPLPTSNMCSVRYRHADVGRARLLPADRGAAGSVRELLGVDLVTVRAAAANVEPCIRADGAKVWGPDAAGAATTARAVRPSTEPGRRHASAVVPVRGRATPPGVRRRVPLRRHPTCPAAAALAGRPTSSVNVPAASGLLDPWVPKPPPWG